MDAPNGMVRFSAWPPKGVSLPFPFYEHKILLFSLFFFGRHRSRWFAYKHTHTLSLSLAEHRGTFKRSKQLNWRNSFRKRIWFGRYANNLVFARFSCASYFIFSNSFPACTRCPCFYFGYNEPNE